MFFYLSHLPVSHSCYVLTNLQAILVLSSPTFRSFVYFPDLPVDHYCDFLTYLKVIIVVSWPTWRSLLWFPDLPVGRCSWGHIAAWPGSTARDLQEFVFTKQVDPTVLCSAHLKLFRFILSIFKSGSGSAKKPGSKTQLFFPGSRYWHGPHGPVSSAFGLRPSAFGTHVNMHELLRTKLFRFSENTRPDFQLGMAVAQS